MAYRRVSLVKPIFLLAVVCSLFIPAQVYGSYQDEIVEFIKNNSKSTVDGLTADIDINGTIVEEYFDPTEEEIDEFTDDTLDWGFTFLELFFKTEKVAESGTNLVSKHEVPSWLLWIVGVVVAGIIIGSILRRFIIHLVIIVGISLFIIALLAYWGYIS